MAMTSRRLLATGLGAIEREHLPIATLSVLLSTGIVTGLQFVYPDVLGLLRRNPAAFTQHEWWRLLTPLFVQADGWPQFIVNIVGIALVGVAVERFVGSKRWLFLYFGGGLVGEVAGYAWEPYGAGSSVALCGLIGGLVVLRFAPSWNGSDRVQMVASAVTVYFVGGLLGSALYGIPCCTFKIKSPDGTIGPESGSHQ